jgi:hypothetical protein
MRKHSAGLATTIMTLLTEKIAVTSSHSSPKDAKNQTIFRTSKRERYFSVSNALAQNPDLSLEAKGLMLFVLSLPTNHEFRSWWLQKHCGAKPPTRSTRTGKKRDGSDAPETPGRLGREKFQNILHELEGAGYLTRELSHKDNGTFACGYTFHDEPQTVKPSTVKPQTVKPATNKERSIRKQSRADDGSVNVRKVLERESITTTTQSPGSSGSHALSSPGRKPSHSEKMAPYWASELYCELELVMAKAMVAGNPGLQGTLKTIDDVRAIPKFNGIVMLVYTNAGGIREAMCWDYEAYLTMTPYMEEYQGVDGFRKWVLTADRRGY